MSLFTQSYYSALDFEGRKRCFNGYGWAQSSSMP